MENSLLTAGLGALIGLALALTGAGGGILAMPLLDPRATSDGRAGCADRLARRGPFGSLGTG